ncbi:hypothetical protein I6N96_01770 [Enterococcus sp. BWM-S5]|uniref:Uncharacterized protein n=1 Tax=Enterococcus larvae TaxID=2794352 RepID=A0ABS4CEY9_9ENTE|nr:hypothetical protein [Enterococcus larvae]MBP1044990.1 hypothetical protein [Enterococcus larvae]
MNTWIEKNKKIWWVFTLLAGIFAYLNPSIGFFSLLYAVFFLVDMGLRAMVKGQYKALVINDNDSQLKSSLFNKGLLFFIVMKSFFSIASIAIPIVILNESLNNKKLMTPYYFSLIAESAILKLLCVIISIISVLISWVLFIGYIRSFKQKL